MPDNREIGGYFELERATGSIYHDDAVALNCGRGCIEYEVHVRNIERVWVPDYMCDVVPAEFKRLGVEVCTYEVGEDFEPVWTFPIVRGDWLYVCDYFGQLSDSCRQNALDASGGRLIIDEAQGYFVRPMCGVDTLYTCRKFLGVSDGGFDYTDGLLLTELERDVSWQRTRYMLGRLEEGARAFFSDAQKNNDEVADGGMKRMSLLTETILRGIDYPKVIDARETNWKRLDDLLGEHNSLELCMPVGPFAYPLLVEDGPSVRRSLAEMDIFVPTLWPNVLEDTKSDSVAYRYARDILPLPIDQRYGEEDMQRIASALKEEGAI